VKHTRTELKKRNEDKSGKKASTSQPEIGVSVGRVMDGPSGPTARPSPLTMITRMTRTTPSAPAEARTGAIRYLTKVPMTTSKTSFAAKTHLMRTTTRPRAVM
jgi:hypothetical protein